MKSLTRSELDALLIVVRKHSEQDYLMFLVTFSHGLRVSETLSLTRENLVSSHLIVQRQKGSNKTCQPLLDDERAALEELAAKTEGRLFPMSRTTFWRRMHDYGREAGIAQVLLHPHVLRHSAGRLGYLGGMGVAEIQRYLGHRNGANTMIYIEASESEACSAFAAAVTGRA